VAKHRVLWIEDSAFIENTMLLAPVYLSGRYDPTIALTATDGYDALQRQDFDAVIVDIRIPPGDDQRWVDAYFRSFESLKAGRLGLKLLDVVLAGPKEQWRETLSPAARDPERYGVLTVEGINELRNDLSRLGVSVYRDKGRNETADALLQMLEEITNRHPKREATSESANGS